jgi:hypothetical protein
MEPISRFRDSRPPSLGRGLNVRKWRFSEVVLALEKSAFDSQSDMCCVDRITCIANDHVRVDGCQGREIAGEVARDAKKAPQGILAADDTLGLALGIEESFLGAGQPRPAGPSPYVMCWNFGRR